MILRATFRNIFSFKDETQISFVAGKSDKHPSQVARATTRSGISVLKNGIIYGANASGKSNIIKSISLFQKILLDQFSFRESFAFKLSDSSDKTSKVELEFKSEGKYYALGVEFSIKGIAEEWLYEINSRSEKKIYERKVTREGNEFSFKESKMKKETYDLNNFIFTSTAITDSYLSEYVRRHGKGLNEIKHAYNWIKYNLKIIFPNSRYRGLVVFTEKNKTFAYKTYELLKYFNTGITDIKRTLIKDKELAEIPDDIINEAKSEIAPSSIAVISSPRSEIYYVESDNEGKVKFYKQHTIHKSKDDKDIIFNMSEESDGSKRLLDFIPMLIDFSINDAVYLIDEIDRSMHPMLTKQILEFYISLLSNERDTQLIFTTHESNLLNLDIIRSDAVWFVEKGNDGATHLTSLSEYKPRQDIQKGYLLGRYGAIPFFAPVETLNWNSNETSE